MKGQADPVQEEDDVAEDPDTVAPGDCDVGPMNGNFISSVVSLLPYIFLPIVPSLERSCKFLTGFGLLLIYRPCLLFSINDC